MEKLVTDGLIFDVDGTLWDSTPVVEQAWNHALSDMGITDVVITADQLKGLFGLPMDVIIDNVLPEKSKEIRRQYKPLCYHYEHEYLTKKPGILYPKLKETLTELGKRFPLFIVSNCQEGYVELFYEKTGFECFFRDHLCPGDTGLLKADNIRLIAERYGLKQPVYVGDTQMDADACKEAGVPIVFASYGFGKVKDPDGIIHEPWNLCKLFRP